MSATALPAQPHLEAIEALTACATELAKAAADIARRSAQDGSTGFIAASAEFRHCFFAVRMGVRLAAQLRAGRAIQALRAPPAAEMDRPDPVERPERERPEPGLDSEREREDDHEPVSLPQFLKTLGVAATAAERRGDELPTHIRKTTLPALRGLLAEAGAEGAAGGKSAVGAALLARPPAPPAPAARSRLLGTASATLAPPLRRRDSG